MFEKYEEKVCGLTEKFARACGLTHMLGNLDKRNQNGKLSSSSELKSPSAHSI